MLILTCLLICYNPKDTIEDILIKTGALVRPPEGGIGPDKGTVPMYAGGEFRSRIGRLFAEYLVHQVELKKQRVKSYAILLGIVRRLYFVDF